MALNPNIPLSARPSDLSQLGQSVSRGIDNTARIQQTRQQGQLNEQQLLQNKFNALDERQQRVTRSLVQGAASVESLVDSNDDEAIEFSLNQRIERLNELGIDTSDTQRELQIFRDNPNLFKSNVKNAVNFGKRLGILKTQTAANIAGGATGILVDRLRQENPDLSFDDALFQVQTGNRQGVRSQQGEISQIEGLSEARSNIAREEARAKETGKLEAQLELEPSVSRAVEIAKTVGGEDAVKISELNSRIAGLPRLRQVVDELMALGRDATFTKAGQAADIFRREAGLPVGKGAIARTAFISKIDNEILPLLRQTFGAQFTEREGQSLKSTLGDPNKSPVEKEAVLKTFIATKIGQIETLQRQINPNQETSTQINFLGFE